MGVGGSVGAGIFVIFGTAVQPTGPAVSVSFFLASFASVFSALCYAELAARIPISGSVYIYAYAAFGELLALLVGVNFMVDNHFSAALSIMSCANYLRGTVASEFSPGYFPSCLVLSLLFAVLLTGVLSVGVESGLKKANALLVFGKLTIVLIIIGMGSTKMHPENLLPFAPYGVMPVISTTSTCTYAFIGFGTVASAAEECVNPRRDLPIGIIVSLLICACLYVAFAIVLCGIVPFREISVEAPVVDAFGPKYANIPAVDALVDWGSVLGLLTTVLVGMYSQARVYLAMARDGLICSFFKRVSPSFGTPMRAQVLCGVLAAALLCCVPVKRIVRFLNIGTLSSYSVVCAGVLALRAERPGAAARASGMVLAVSTLASAVSSHAGPLFGTALLALVLLSWLPLLWQRYTVPLTFACPLCPLLPLLGITINGYMLSQCPWEAWLRLAVVTAVVCGLYVPHALRAVDSNDNSPAPEDSVSSSIIIEACAAGAPGAAAGAQVRHSATL
ncbi:unnamed protein product [Prorocentrum cordatum]|uniref:Cationic amino acid transporter C-terminal domain-containing protein n=1 Tax=Prorocentrum cordatum TaxID=2364126 RepID=A0ABN9QN81_9DINO|nr:unnamed protein product [Polarella glacialis]